ncbi:MAG: patatin-like phospholipase family protein, partial [Frankia sp.]|nr:patatin-like phospholipase family protein [Frankia sp.]
MARKRAPRRGLVLGAGGVLGSAWMIGALRAYQSRTGLDVRSFDVIVGTSAGSVLAALLGLGVSVDTMADSERGVYPKNAPVLDYRDLGPTLPPRPAMRIGSPRLLTASALHPTRVTPMVAVAALLPQGRGKISAIGELIAKTAARHEVEDGHWPAHIRVAAMDFDTGDRVLFGAEASPVAPLPDAVMASCAVPGWFAPVRIEGRRYIDGGTRSPTSLDLCAAGGLDEIVVLAPACAFETDRPRHPIAAVERQLRRSATRRLVREISLAEATGARVLAVCPGPADLAVMGGNVMDITRRAEVFETSLHTSDAAFAKLLTPVTPARRTPVPQSLWKPTTPATPVAPAGRAVAVPGAATPAVPVTQVPPTGPTGPAAANGQRRAPVTRRTGPARRASQPQP